MATVKGHVGLLTSRHHSDVLKNDGKPFQLHSLIFPGTALLGAQTLLVKIWGERKGLGNNLACENAFHAGISCCWNATVFNFCKICLLIFNMIGQVLSSYCTADRWYCFCLTLAATQHVPWSMTSCIPACDCTILIPS